MVANLKQNNMLPNHTRSRNGGQKPHGNLILAVQFRPDYQFRRTFSSRDSLSEMSPLLASAGSPQSNSASAMATKFRGGMAVEVLQNLMWVLLERDSVPTAPASRASSSALMSLSHALQSHWWSSSAAEEKSFSSAWGTHIYHSAKVGGSEVDIVPAFSLASTTTNRAGTRRKDVPLWTQPQSTQA